MHRIELIRTSFHRRGAEIAEGAQSIGFSLRSGRLCGSLFLVIDLLRNTSAYL
jgi:hypothetical protein